MKQDAANVLLMKVKITPFISTFLLLKISLASLAQNPEAEIPIGEWRMHVSYNNALDVEIGNSNIFCAAKNGVFYYSKESKEINTITKINGLSDSDITETSFDPISNTLLIGYSNGNLDIVSDSGIENYNAIKESNQISKSINQILNFNGLAYICTDFGVVVINPNTVIATDSYLNLGANGEVISINSAAVFGDSLFLATEVGVISGSLSGSNLSDFNNWKRYGLASGHEAHNYEILGVYESKVYVSSSSTGIFTYNGTRWEEQAEFVGLSIDNISYSNTWLTVTSDSQIWSLEDDQFVNVEFEGSSNPRVSKFDENLILWVADYGQGLVTNEDQNSTSIIPSGPSSDYFFNLTQDDDILIGLSGGYDVERNPLLRTNGLYTFESGLWTNYSFQLFDPIDVARILNSEDYIIISWGDGYITWDGGTNFNHFNTSSQSYPFQSDTLGSVISFESSLWVSVLGDGLYQSVNGDIWVEVVINELGSDQIIKTAHDLSGNLWMIVDPVRDGGLIVFNPQSGLSRRLTALENMGGLPSNKVNDISVDNSGNVWVGTQEGAGYFAGGIDLLQGSINLVKPILDGRFLLENESVNAIAADGGNRKWMGTENGAWLFSEFGDEFIAKYDAENSPLLSSDIIDIDIHPNTGEVFISNALGLSSFRSDATNAPDELEKSIKIFPNPVPQNFAGTVAFEGLANDSEVSITDLSGNLIWRMLSNGGTASWKLQTLVGGPPSIGIYLVFSSTAAGEETIVGKLAIID